MRMHVELKPPRLFGRKAKDGDDKGELDISVNDKKISEMTLVVGVTLVAGFGLGYLVGFNRGVNKNSSVYIIK